MMQGLATGQDIIVQCRQQGRDKDQAGPGPGQGMRRQGIGTGRAKIR